MIKNSCSLFIIILIQFFITSVILSESVGDENQVTIVTEHNPPFVYINENNEHVGSDIDIIKPLLEKSAISYKIQSVSWKRALATLKQQHNVMGFPVSRIPKREKQFKWIVPLHSITYHLFGVKDKFDIKLSDLGSGKYNFICSDKTAACTVLKNFGVPDSSIVKLAHVNNKQIIDMVFRDRVNFMIFTNEEFEYFLEQMKYDRSQFSALENYHYELVEYLVGDLQFDDQLIKKIREAAQSTKAK